MEDNDGLVHEVDEGDHEASMDEDGGAASVDAEPEVRRRQNGQPSTTKHKRLPQGALPAGHTDFDTITDLLIMKLVSRLPLPTHRSALREAGAAQPSPGDMELNTAREAGLDVKIFHNICGEAGHRTGAASVKRECHPPSLRQNHATRHGHPQGYSGGASQREVPSNQQRGFE